MDKNQMIAENAKLEKELKELKSKSGMLTSAEKQQIKNLVSKIEGREKEDGTIVKLLPNHSIVVEGFDANGKKDNNFVSLLDVLKGSLKNSVVTDDEKGKIKSLENRIKAFDTLIGA